MKDLNHNALSADLERLRWQLTDTTGLSRPNRHSILLDAIGTVPGISIVGLFDPAEVWALLVSDTRIAPDLRYWWPDCTALIDFKNLETAYGRAGLNDNQQRTAERHPTLVIATAEDVERYGIK